jgi:hypothetical protein
MIPNAAASETRLSSAAFSDSTTDLNARVSRISVSRSTKPST